MRRLLKLPPAAVGTPPPIAEGPKAAAAATATGRRAARGSCARTHYEPRAGLLAAPARLRRRGRRRECGRTRGCLCAGRKVHTWTATMPARTRAPPRQWPTRTVVSSIRNATMMVAIHLARWLAHACPTACCCSGVRRFWREPRFRFTLRSKACMKTVASCCVVRCEQCVCALLQVGECVVLRC